MAEGVMITSTLGLGGAERALGEAPWGFQGLRRMG